MTRKQINMLAWKLGRIVGFAFYPVTFVIVAYAAYVAAQIAGAH